jgi:hypothetical protein
MPIRLRVLSGLFNFGVLAPKPDQSLRLDEDHRVSLARSYPPGGLNPRSSTEGFRPITRRCRAVDPYSFSITTNCKTSCLQSRGTKVLHFNHLLLSLRKPGRNRTAIYLLAEVVLPIKLQVLPVRYCAIGLTKYPLRVIRGLHMLSDTKPKTILRTPDRSVWKLTLQY